MSIPSERKINPIFLIIRVLSEKRKKTLVKMENNPIPRPKKVVSNKLKWKSSIRRDNKAAG